MLLTPQRHWICSSQTLEPGLPGSDRISTHMGIHFHLQYLQHKANKTKGLRFFYVYYATYVVNQDERLSGSFTRSCLDSTRIYSTGYRRRPPRPRHAWFPPFRCPSAVAVSSFPLRKFRKNCVSAVRITLPTRKKSVVP